MSMISGLDIRITDVICKNRHIKLIMGLKYENISV